MNDSGDALSLWFCPGSGAPCVSSLYKRLSAGDDTWLRRKVQEAGPDRQMGCAERVYGNSNATGGASLRPPRFVSFLLSR